MAWNCGRLATATSIFCSIADAFVTRCRLFVIRDNDALNFANWCSWSFVCEGVASATTSASILLGKRKNVDLRLLVSIGCMGCSAVPQSGICFAWKYGIRISQVIVFLLRFMLFYFVCERAGLWSSERDRRFVDDSLLCSWLYDLLVASKCWSVVLVVVSCFPPV